MTFVSGQRAMTAYADLATSSRGRLFVHIGTIEIIMVTRYVLL
jgi:hypothetical protein